MKKNLLLFGLFSAFQLALFSQHIFTSSGTYTVPNNVTSITVEVVGRGGSAGSNGGGGGGGGGYSKGTFTVTPGQSISYTVATASNQTSAVPSLGISATNGSNGSGGSAAPGGSGGWGVGGSVNHYGGNGGNGHYTYFGGGGGGAAGPNGNGSNGAYPGPPPPYLNPGGAGGTSGGYPGGDGGKGSGFLDNGATISNHATPGANYGGGAGGGNGNGGPASAPANGVVIIHENVTIISLHVATLNNVPADISIDNGTLQMTSYILPANASQNVVWSIVPVTGDATISAGGLVSAEDNGLVWAKAVSVFDNTKKDSMLISISNQIIPITNLTVSTFNNVLPEITSAAGTLLMVSQITPANANQAVTWSIVPNTGNASISSTGLVTATENGTVWAKATSVQDATQKDSMEITITNQPIAVASITVTTQNNVASTITTLAGTLQMIATVLPSNALQDVTWSIIPVSGNALINSTGLVIANANGTVWAKAATVANPAISDSLIIYISNQSTSIEESEQNPYRVFPNPTQSELSIQFEQKNKEAELQLIDISGRVILQKVIQENYMLNLSDIPSGMYILQIRIEGRNYTEKINKN